MRLRILQLLLSIPVGVLLLAAVCVNAADQEGVAGVASGDFNLITSQEAIDYQGAEGYAMPANLRIRALSPSIELVQPAQSPELRVKAPVNIVVVFKPLADAPIDPASFKVSYGALQLDITSRITPYLSISPSGFKFDQASIPTGKHRLLIQVRDTKDRRAELDVRLLVE